MKILKAIQSGMILLGIECQESSPGAGQYKTKKSMEKIFSKDVLDDY